MLCIQSLVWTKHSIIVYAYPARTRTSAQDHCHCHCHSSYVISKTPSLECPSEQMATHTINVATVYITILHTANGIEATCQRLCCKPLPAVDSSETFSTYMWRGSLLLLYVITEKC